MRDRYTTTVLHISDGKIAGMGLSHECHPPPRTEGEGGRYVWKITIFEYGGG